MTVQTAISAYRENYAFSRQKSTSQDSSTPEKSPSYQAMISKLESIDTKVRAHEAAHISAGGGIVTGGADFGYTKGPDGKMYATSGEVPIDTSEGKSPEETIQRARQIAAAAMAPADPSPQDYRVAATASVMEMRAHLEQAKELQDKINGQKAYGFTASAPLAPQSEAA